jgi:hypothetical protein
LTLGARATVLALGAGAGLSTRSDADTTSMRLAELPASWTSAPPALARSCSRSELTLGCSEFEQAAAAASRSAVIEYRRECLMVSSTPECQKGAIGHGPDRCPAVEFGNAILGWTTASLPG